MKNLIDTKKSLDAALSRFGRVLPLLIISLALGSSAFAKTYYIDTTPITGYTVEIKDLETTSGIKIEYSATATTGIWSFDLEEETAFYLQLRLKKDDASYLKSLDDITASSTYNSCAVSYANSKLSYEWKNAAPASTLPSILIAQKPTVSGTTATINLQLSDWGCAEVEQVNVYYTTNGDSPTKESDSWELSTSQNSNAIFSVQKSDLSTGDYKIKVAAVNSAGVGELSAEASFSLACITPTPQTVTIGAEEICSTGSTTISLGGSQSGYTYELYINGVTTGKTVACTGESVSFTDISAAGTYSVKGYQSNLATCIEDMSNTVTLSTIPDMALTSITLSKDAECVGKTLTITPNGYNAGGSGSITYSSTDTSVATVDNTTVTVVGAGSTTIKANVTGGCGSDIERTADLSGAGVAISGPSPSPIHEYEPTTFTAAATADWAVSPASNEAYLLTDTGSSTILKAKKGTYTISATKDDCTSTKQVTVTEWPNRCN